MFWELVFFIYLILVYGGIQFDVILVTHCDLNVMKSAPADDLFLESENNIFEVGIHSSNRFFLLEVCVSETFSLVWHVTWVKVQFYF